MTYNSFLGLTNETDPNGSSATIGYDVMARPSSTTSPFGATTTTTYNDTASPPTVQTNVNGRWTRTTMDGLGRTVKVETGYSTTTVSVAETEYDSCGCSPTGKMKRTALPHDPGAMQVWTTYTYDGIGRTLTKSTVGTDTTSTTNYLYQGNTVTVTDAVGNWKKYTMDALGQLTQVNEPNPAGGLDYVTTYTYDTLGHLTGVSMPRPSGTQTRTFNYGNPPGAQLLSATNPENGTVSYTYNSDHTLATKTDAKSQQVQYSYDSYKRVTQIRRGTYSGGTFNEDTCQQENYYYDAGQYGLGRLTSMQYKGGLAYFVGNPVCDHTFTETFTYNSPGGMTSQSLGVSEPAQNYSQGGNISMALTANYTYDNEGRITATQYPSSWGGYSWVSGPNLGNTFDSTGRLQKLTDLTASSDIISNATYGAAGQLLTMTGANGAPSETRTYNSIGQLTQLQSGSLNVQYAYSATQNNGKITSETDVVSGEQVAYAYDSLNRLATATSSVNPGWGQSYTYDGFGNLTQQTVTKGTAPSLSVSYDPATNRQTGGECADANGNLNARAPFCGAYVYDVENRIVAENPIWLGAQPTVAYSYRPGNKRVWKGTNYVANGQTNWSLPSNEEVTFWSITGQKLVAYNVTQYQPGGPDTLPQLVASQTGTNYYFGGKLVKNSTGYVTPDRLGSIGKYFPYGQERPSATQDGKEKFATYFRDSETGLDYAQNRYHQPGMGRFMSADPYAASGGPNDPGSWNRYAYTRGDPVNRGDPSGLDDEEAQCAAIADAPGFIQGFNGGAVQQCADLYPDGQGPEQGGGGFYDPNPSVFANDLGSATAGNSLDFSSAYDLNNGTPGFGPPGDPNNGKSGTSDCIAKGLQSTFPGTTATMGSSTGEVGGHWNFSLQLQFSSQGAAYTFGSMYTTASSGWPPPARFGPGPALHLENLGRSWSFSDGTYTIGATAHIDLFSPDTGAGGIAGHVLVDGAWGHIVQFFGGNIDPKACPF